MYNNFDGIYTLFKDWNDFRYFENIRESAIRESSMRIFDLSRVVDAPLFVLVHDRLSAPPLFSFFCWDRLCITFVVGLLVLASRVFRYLILV